LATRVCAHRRHGKRRPTPGRHACAPKATESASAAAGQHSGAAGCARGSAAGGGLGARVAQRGAAQRVHDAREQFGPLRGCKHDLRVQVKRQHLRGACAVRSAPRMVVRLPGTAAARAPPRAMQGMLHMRCSRCCEALALMHMAQVAMACSSVAGMLGALHVFTNCTEGSVRRLPSGLSR